MSKTIDEWLSLYGQSHQNRINKLIHWVCVPVITWTVIALLWGLSINQSAWLNAGMVFIIAALVFYARLDFTIMAGMAVFAACCVALIFWHIAVFDTPLWITAVGLFVIAWVGQFIGHKIEGKKPSFFQDIKFLLIGPAWLLSFIYRQFRVGH